jgi:DNA-3-methyladenine glycosylase
LGPNEAKLLPASFYARPTLDVLRDLIGKVLVHDVRGRRSAGVIVEAEAYIGESDPACHAAPGPTRRNAPLYGPPGRAYVYFNYGMHHLVNAVTEDEGVPAAVLIRALEPREGIDLMRQRRARRSNGAGRASSRRAPLDHARGRLAETTALCRGPGNLTVAMGIDLRQNTHDLTSGALSIEDHGIGPVPLGWSARIGIRVGADRPWRCYWEGNACVSGRPTGRRVRSVAGG